MMRVGCCSIRWHGAALAWLCAWIAVVGGCAASLRAPAFLSGSRKEEVAETAADKLPPGDDPQAIALRKALGDKPLTQEQAYADISPRLREIRAIDPDAERQVVAELEHAKPEQYALVVETFRTALAYKQQLAERRDELIPANEDRGLISKKQVQLASHELPADDGASVRRGAAVQASLSSSPLNARRVDAPPISSRSRRQASANAAQPARRAAPLRAGAQASVEQAGAEEPVSVADDVVVAESDVEPTATEQPARQKLKASAVPASHEVQASGDWKSELNATIADLQARVSPSPASVDELHDHMRLRALALLAGREEEAYRPIPGASAAQQDYWSKQLFAMSTYLGAGGKLDDKQRAAAALAPLDEARAKLSELATLQIRNAAFVTSVDGFGAYEPRKTASFRPGQKASLYAEVENFRSESRDDGYHTSLGTSYQILDKTGKRIDGKQFPEVADKCRNHRRDFHMQYEFPLPAGMAPGEYTLELTITDHNSGKIGQTTLPFEISGR